MNTSQQRDILILVVDDDALVREVIAEIFLEEGFSVIQASRASEALKQLELHDDIRLLFTDIQMPGELNGLALVEIVHQRWPDILLMVASGRVHPKSEDLPDDARFVQKPFDQSEMIEEVKDLFSQHPGRLDS